MNKTASSALLPEGLHDTLAPDAGREARAVAQILACFHAYGYDQVSPPLAEFEDTLLAGVGAGQAATMFRLMDPASKRMLGIRTDITTQIARIATTRLVGATRPLRLCYAGQVLRVSGNQLHTEREVNQTGLELIGDDALGAEVEMLTVMVEAMHKVGVDDFTIDLTMPRFVPVLCEGLGLEDAVANSVRQALDEKDMAALASVSDVPDGLLQNILAAAGPADQAMEKLLSLALPIEAQQLLDQLVNLVKALNDTMPSVVLTVDPGEFRNFPYHTGLCFTVFASDGNGELGRGGRYEITGMAGVKEPAVGFTAYVDLLLRVLLGQSSEKLIYLPLGVGQDVVDVLHADGWRTIQALRDNTNNRSDALAHGCTHLYQDGDIAALKPT